MKKPFRAAICALNSQYIHSSLAPWCLLAGVRAFCRENILAEVIEGTVNEDINAAAKRVVASRPHAVGFCCYIWNIVKVRELIKLVKAALPEAVIILGGPEVSYNAADVLRNTPLADFVLSGEGERPFALLLDALASGDDITGLPGLCRRHGGALLVSPPHIETLPLPSPYLPEYLAALKGRIAYIETSRGCPFSCAFCLSGRCGAARWFDLGEAEKNLLLLAQSGAKTIKFIDRTFNANRAHAAALLRFIQKNYGSGIPETVCFHFEIAGDLLDDELLELFAALPRGCVQLEIGLQSFNARTLEAIDRKTDVIRLENNIRRLLGFGNMHIHIDLIAGLPLEGPRSFAESFDRAFALGPHCLQLGFLKLLHGAPMREEAGRFPCAYSPEPPYEVISTPWLGAAELGVLRDTADALERLYNSGRFRRSLEYLLSAAGVSPFELFSMFGARFPRDRAENCPLDDYSRAFFEFFRSKPEVDEIIFRDALVMDRLASNASGILPQFLRVPDKRLKALRHNLEDLPETRRPAGVKRAAAILYSAGRAVYVDYVNPDPVTGEYKLKYADI